MRTFILAVICFFSVHSYTYSAYQAGIEPELIFKNIDHEENSGVRIHGRLTDVMDRPLPGAAIVIKGTRIGVNTNESGEFIIQRISERNITVEISHLGYQTLTIDLNLDEVAHKIHWILEQDDIVLESITVTSQQREQQLLDVPAAISTISGDLMETAGIYELEQLADFVPGMNARIQTPHRPSLVIRGLTSDEVSPNAQPRVSVYYNKVPVSRASMAVSELYDMERVEVIRGPQGTLFGRGAQIGAVSFITRKPQNNFGGYLTGGLGTYGRQEIQGAFNVPIVDNKLLMRASGVYNYHDGYVENTFGGTLNGKNTIGGRLSLRYLPTSQTIIDMVVNYQKDDNPGTAFMTRRFPNAVGETDIFRYQASLEQGENLYNKRDVLGTSLDIRHYRNENNYWSSITSLYYNTADSRWDGDGTQAPAIDMAETVDVSQFTQEIRYNFSWNGHTNGFFGAGYWREDVEQSYWFAPNEQHMAYLFLQMPEFLVAPDGVAYPMTALPDDPSLGPLAGMPLPTHHEEKNMSGAVNQAYDIFADATWNLTSELSFTTGLRGTYERFRVDNQSMMTGGDPSVLGMFTGNQPNLFFRPVELTVVEKDFFSATWRSNLKYELNSGSNIYAGYSRGRRPNVIQFDAMGESEIMNQELVHSFDAGFKYALMQRLWYDLGIFFHKYKNFQTTAWDANSLNYLIRDAGKATSYGAEMTLKAALMRNLSVFGNYAWIHARFDEEDSDGHEQEYAGNAFRLTPEHSFAVGLNVRHELSSNTEIFVVPTYSWKSHLWFEDANTTGLEQDAYGLMNLRGGFKLKNPNLTLAITVSNLLNEEYIISAGNTGTMFGVPTFIPGAPRMVGSRITWRY